MNAGWRTAVDKIFVVPVFFILKNTSSFSNDTFCYIS